MRQDIYVVQKTAEEGKHLEDWCIQNDVTVNMNYGLGFNPEWNCFAYFNSIDAFCKNYELSSCKLNMQEVTIEEFKRLQLESLGKTKELFILPDEGCLKIGDYITVTDESVSSDFKMVGKITKVKNGESDSTSMRGNATFIQNREKKFLIDKCWCYKSNYGRTYRKSTQEEISWLEECIKQNKYIAFEDLPKQKQNKFEVGKWYKILDNWWAKFKTVHNSGKRWQFSEHIDKNGIYSNTIQSIDVISEIKTLIDLTEIQPYLPDGHPDKIVKDVIPEYAEYIDTKYLGQIVKVEDWTSHNWCKVIFSDGTKGQPFKHLLKPSTKEAFEAQNKPKHEVVHCKTKEEWDFVRSKTTRECSREWEHAIKDYETIGIALRTNGTGWANLDWYKQQNAKVLSFKEWCNSNGYSFESDKETQYKVGDVVIATGNIGGYEKLKGRIAEINLNNLKGHKYCINYEEFNFGKAIRIWSHVHELVEENQLSKEENLVGRWVKRIGYNSYPYYQNPKIGKYDLIEKEDFNNYYLKTFLSCEKEYLLKDFELMPEGFVPNQVEKSNIDFDSLNLEDWLRETKKLNLSQERLQNHIDYVDSCNPNVYKELKGNTLEEKTEILWDEWNGIRGECVLNVQYPLTVIESFKPNTHIHKAQLIEVKTKQIFKN